MSDTATVPERATPGSTAKADRNGGPTGRRNPVRRFVRHVGVAGTVSAAVIALLAVVALLAPWIAPHDPLQLDLAGTYQPSSAEHLLGTDNSGRDLLSRLIWGARTSLLGPLIVVTVTAVLGTALALAAAWFGGRVDNLISRLLDVLFAFPSLLLAVIVIAMYDRGLLQASLALAVGFTPYTARVLRSVSLRERMLPYVASGEIQGFSGFVICIRQILPNITPQILTGATINFGTAMIELAAISFLGLGVQPPTADWGLMVSSGQASLVKGFPQQSLYAGLLIVLTVAAFSVLGERLGGRKAGGRA
ncbi:ABC transporter permease [Peterkaempfera bronchialis]|uniref:ABC transporter permease n=1 Tax=Peterkaempfera bronchialis TaxID=2126346 RepID=A0A345T4P7_9ACTN|nr:ABC transporter permease [Peterkaempfera bronchialis]AXI80952.1 ABC transporter permease [Peterkaempfera bronchialis]